MSAEGSKDEEAEAGEGKCVCAHACVQVQLLSNKLFTAHFTMISLTLPC